MIKMAALPKAPGGEAASAVFFVKKHEPYSETPVKAPQKITSAKIA